MDPNSDGNGVSGPKILPESECHPMPINAELSKSKNRQTDQNCSMERNLMAGKYGSRKGPMV